MYELIITNHDIEFFSKHNEGRYSSYFVITQVVQFSRPPSFATSL